MRRVNYFTLFLIGWISSYSCWGFNHEKDARPNVLLIMTDQHQAEALSCADNPYLNTPNLDRLAQRGHRFEKAYVTFPLCVPSRSSIITGKMPHEIGVYSNEKGRKEMSFEEKERSMGHVMSEAGYKTAYAGKWHAFEPSMVDGYGFESIAPFGDIGLAESCTKFLEQQKTSTKPFFLVASFDNPHNICEYARNQPLPYGGVDQVTLEDTPPLPANFAESPFFPEVIRLEQKANRRVYAAQNFTPEQWRHYRYNYYRLVEKVDEEIGKVLSALEANGLDENTLIIFTSDHGDGNASHQWNQKTALFEESIKVPLILRAPGIKKAGRSSDGLVSVGLDLLPTIYEYAGIAVPDQVAGRSLSADLQAKKTKSTATHEFVVAETMFDGEGAHKTLGRAVIGKKFKYVLYSWGSHREQLFDLESDPGEMVNLATSSKFKSQLNKFRKYLFEWCKRTNDTKFLRKVVLPEGAGSSSQLFDKAY